MPDSPLASAPPDDVGSVASGHATPATPDAGAPSDGASIGVSAHAVFGRPASRRSARDRWRHALPALLLVGTLLVTAAACLVTDWAAHRTDEVRFENAVQAAEDRVSQRFDSYSALLYGARGLFAASDAVTATEFHGFVDGLGLQTHFPGMRGVGYSRRLDPPGAPSDSVSLVAAMHVGGSLTDSLWPRGPRAESNAVVYIEPLDARNRVALGYDMRTDSVRRVAMDRARDLGVPAASGRVVLKQETVDQPHPGFLVYLPVYAGGVTPPDVAGRRAAVRGFVYAPFRGGELFAGIFGSERRPRVAFRVFDGTDTTAAQLLYASDSANAVAPDARQWGRAPLHVIDTLLVAGQPWTLAFTPLRDSTVRAANMPVLVVLALFGTLTGLALFAVMRAEIRAREEAERSEALRGRFFAAMSHELRTPVNAVLGYNDLLLAGIYGPLAAPQEHGIQRSQRAARHLLELVNDVLDLSKLEAGKMEVAVESVRLDELLDDLLVTIRPMAEERGCELRLERPACARSVETDPRRLRQILLNLLSNATKFGAGRPVVVRCAELPHGATLPGRSLLRQDRRRTAGDAMVIAVTDDGPGIARGDQERIFEEFVQLPGSTAGGTGLGLPISRRLAELLGGQLAVTSSPGRGATFTVTIPCTRRR